MEYLTREEIKQVFEYFDEEDFESISKIIDDPIFKINPEEMTDEQEEKICEVLASKIDKNDYEWMYKDKDLNEWLPEIIAGTKNSELIKEYAQDSKYQWTMREKAVLVVGTKDSEYIKKMIKDINNDWQPYQLYTLTKATNDPNFIMQMIEDKNYKWDKWMFDELLVTTEDIEFIEKHAKKMEKIRASSLIAETGNPEFIKKALADEEYNWDEWSIANLTAATKDSKFIKKTIHDKEDDWNPYMLERMVIATSDPKFIKEALQKYKWYSDQVLNLIVATHDKEFMKSCITNKEFTEKYKLDRIEDFASLINPMIDEFSHEEKYELFQNLRDNGKKYYIMQYRKYKGEEYIKENIEEVMKLEGEEERDIPKKKEILMKMYSVNNDVLGTIDFSILDEVYIKELGIEKINQISCYPKVQEKVLNLNDKELQVFSKCINENEIEEWTPLAQSILENISEYEGLIHNIENNKYVDVEKLTKVLQDRNIFEIATLEDLENYDQIRKEKCDEWIKDSNIEQKKVAVLEKLYGHSEEYAKMIIEKYGEDIENIEDGDCKDYVRSLKAIIEMDNSQILEKIYDECKEIENINKVGIERELKTEYGKLFNEELFKIEEGTEVEDGIYEAGPEFEMIITSLGAFHGHKIENYKSDWNRPSIATQHFCASYIRNDMIGTAPVHNICYRI